MNFKPVTHVIFDMDGLLLDTEDIYKSIIGRLAKKWGGDYTEDIRVKILGTKQQDTVRIAIREMKLTCTEEQFMEEYKILYLKELANVDLMPGAEKLICHLHKNNIPIAIGTSSSYDSVDVKISTHKELFSLFDHTTSGTSDPDVKDGKPSPDIFLVCASKFPDKPNSSKCLVFEDAPNGVEAALAAGMQCVMVPSAELDKSLTQRATLTINSLEEFKPELFGLPPF